MVVVLLSQMCLIQSVLNNVHGLAESDMGAPPELKIRIKGATVTDTYSRTFHDGSPMSTHFPFEGSGQPTCCSNKEC